MKKIMFDDRFCLTEAVISRIKTKTRRICKEQHWSFSDLINANVNHTYLFERPPYQIGEVVAIAQSYKDIGLDPVAPLVEANGVGGYIRAELSPGWSNKMFVRADLMPYQIQFADLRVERLQDISDEDCIKELGLDRVSRNMGYGNAMSEWVYQIRWDDKMGRTQEYSHRDPKEVFAIIIDKICGRGTWESNPFVFAYEFELINHKTNQ